MRRSRLNLFIGLALAFGAVPALDAQVLTPYHIEDLRWSPFDGWPGSYAVRGVFVNDSAETLTMPTIFVTLFDQNGTTLGDVGASQVQSLAPGGRWAFGNSVFAAYSLATAYAKITRIVCIVAGPNGQPQPLDLTPPNAQIWSPEAIERQHVIQESEARRRERQMKSVVGEFERTHPCPTTGKTKGSCKSHYPSFIVDPRDGGEISIANIRWVEYKTKKH
jgi:hypothetical protein